MLADPPLGTPRRPNQFIPTYIFSLFNENQKTGPGTERHWGLLYPNGSRLYEIDLTGELQDSEYKPLPPPPPPYKGKLWCVVDANANVSALPSAITYACSQGNNTCVAIQPGKPCYQPNTVIDHASYAFNSYWQQFKNSGGTCYFNGAATLVTKDPSSKICRYPFAWLISRECGVDIFLCLTYLQNCLHMSVLCGNADGSSICLSFSRSEDYTSDSIHCRGAKFFIFK